MTADGGIAIACFAIAGTVYLGLAGLFALSWKGRKAGITFIAAAGVTAVWAFASAWQAASGATQPSLMVDLLGLGRPALWLFLAYAVLRLLSVGAPSLIALRDPLYLVMIAAIVLSGVAIVVGPGLVGGSAAADLRFVPNLALSVLGMVLVENLYHAGRSGAFWAVKHLLIGLGALFTFDLFMYADALLLKRMSGGLYAAQPLVSVLAAPLFVVAAARLRDFAINVHVTRRVAVHTAALISCGIYLLAAAAVAALLRRFDLTWGPTLQVVFLVGALVVLAVLLSSTQARAHGRHFIERNFFSFAYDYREEWLRLVRTMTEREGDPSLSVRAVKASAQVFDCGAGALFWRPSEDLAFQPAGFWNWSKPAAGTAPPDPLLRLVSAARPAVELRMDQTFAADDAEERAIREWLSRFKEPWILLALHVRGRLLGFILIGCPMLSRRLGWEDHELLSVLASQIGSYLAVEQIARQLAEAQRFETVSKQFSFVAHDLKNLITQLSIILEQARRHSGNPVFVEDALVTVGEAVEKMRTMLLRLRQTTPKQPQMLDVSELVERLVARANAGELQITFEKRAADLVVRAEPDDLNSVIQNVIDNACEARTDPEAQVGVVVREREGSALVEIADKGPGMTPDFVEEELFTPFSSTKVHGLGIGMYQCRQQVERWGGSLEIDSAVGRGTTVRIALPLARERIKSRVDGFKIPA